MTTRPALKTGTRPPFHGWASLSLASVCLLSGCVTSGGKHSLPSVSPVSVPETISETEAASLALANHPGFLELTDDLGIARAELIQAGELPNPGFSVLFPMGPKQLEFAAKLPVESLWLRPHRIEIASRNVESVAQRLLQDGLDVVREVKLSCVELRLAQDRVKLAQEELDLLQRFSKVARARLEAGDISELEVTTAEADALRSQIDRDRSPHAVVLAEAKLRHLMGLDPAKTAPLTLSEPTPLPSLERDDEAILEQALAARPDLRAAEIAIEAEGKRIGLARTELLQVTAIFDANGDASNFEAGPGLDLILPLFHQNQGTRALADARFKKACHHYLATRNQIALEVTQALARYRQADRDFQRVREELLPRLKETIEQTERAWEGGEVSYLFVLDSTRKAHAARVSEAELLAEWRRAAAELERSTGAPSLLNLVNDHLDS